VNIYVGNLPLDVAENELQQEFVPFGEVVSVIIMNDKYIGSGQIRGYGFVEMASKSEGKAAISNLTGKIIKGRAINVVEALPLSNMRNINSRKIRSRFNRSDRGRSY